jgi:hypothetical protein
VSSKRPSKPVWWKNTFFWFGFALFGLGLWGLVSGEAVIRDPGQKFETGLVILYFGASILMLLNGWMTHSQAIQHYHELVDTEDEDLSSEDEEA